MKKLSINRLSIVNVLISDIESLLETQLSIAEKLYILQLKMKDLNSEIKDLHIDLFADVQYSVKDIENFQTSFNAFLDRFDQWIDSIKDEEYAHPAMKMIPSIMYMVSKSMRQESAEKLATTIVFKPVTVALHASLTEKSFSPLITAIKDNPNNNQNNADYKDFLVALKKDADRLNEEITDPKGYSEFLALIGN